MRDSWLGLVDVLRRPARPNLARCVRERERHVASRQAWNEQRTRAVAACERSIEAARTDVFAANDGRISWRMIELEREWRRLSRRDPDAGLMDLWARMAPPSWIDRKRWRDAAPSSQLASAVLLAADPEGVEAAESAIARLRASLETWGIRVGSRIRWRLEGPDVDATSALLEGPSKAALEALSSGGAAPAALARARRLEEELKAATLARFPERTLLARSVAHAAFVDHALKEARGCGRPSPIEPLRELWRTGYLVASLDSTGAVLDVPEA